MKPASTRPATIRQNRWLRKKRRIAVIEKYNTMVAFHLAMQGNLPGLPGAFRAALDQAVAVAGTSDQYGLLDFSNKLLQVAHDFRDGPAS